ncbi:CehA/McbA family metallohydrolase [Streptomyces endophyticus]|uniref:CehA/McbA family metallohydrolase n=1 Tax=Streptomyces endophyticus TaxID=714166 RepID=A0ABU6F336_9ACTN|nr:CehA/McbA family metallohydrolase [Streptomyces endophyticus]MEB8337815.1 CehA/McbA family metallohydrolase [Streptomyces endophyticus]
MSSRRVLRETRTIDPASITEHYLDRVLALPEGVGTLRVELDFEKVTDCFQLYAAALDPGGFLRGHVQCPGDPGPRRLSFEVGEEHADLGCHAGPLPAGEWTIRIDLDRFTQGGSYELRVFVADADADADAGRAVTAVGRTGVVRAAPVPPSPPTWLRGELHSHSLHSDGSADLPALLDAARAAGLDFLAVSDHFTSSHWAELARLEEQGAAEGLVLLRSIELTSHFGHANLHGLSRWPGTYVDADGWDFADAARDVHAQDGLVGVNHPFSGRQAWRRDDHTWDDVDLLEIDNFGQGANNDAAVGLWDRLLGSGHRITGVAGTDCHHPQKPEHRLGQVTTVVRAERSREGILGALRAGEAYVSRGAGLRLSARTAAGQCGMGGTVPLDGPVHLDVELDTPRPAVLFILRGGLLWHMEPVAADGPARIRVTDPRPLPGPYRAELHASSDDPYFWASCNRSHASSLAVSNPVWVAATSPREAERHSA